jgi:hypothetical protein
MNHLQVDKFFSKVNHTINNPVVFVTTTIKIALLIVTTTITIALLSVWYTLLRKK